MTQKTQELINEILPEILSARFPDKKDEIKTMCKDLLESVESSKFVKYPTFEEWLKYVNGDNACTQRILNAKYYDKGLSSLLNDIRNEEDDSDADSNSGVYRVKFRSVKDEDSNPVNTDATSDTNKNDETFVRKEFIDSLYDSSTTDNIKKSLKEKHEKLYRKHRELLHDYYSYYSHINHIKNSTDIDSDTKEYVEDMLEKKLVKCSKKYVKVKEKMRIIEDMLSAVSE